MGERKTIREVKWLDAFLEDVKIAFIPKSLLNLFFWLEALTNHY